MIGVPTHPLADSDLGPLKRHEVLNVAEPGAPADWVVDFYYANDVVRLSVASGQYHYNRMF